MYNFFLTFPLLVPFGFIYQKIVRIRGGKMRNGRVRVVRVRLHLYPSSVYTTFYDITIYSAKWYPAYRFQPFKKTRAIYFDEWRVFSIGTGKCDEWRCLSKLPFTLLNDTPPIVSDFSKRQSFLNTLGTGKWLSLIIAFTQRFYHNCTRPIIMH